MDAVAADIDIEYQDHIKQARELLALQKQRVSHVFKLRRTLKRARKVCTYRA